MPELGYGEAIILAYVSVAVGILLLIAGIVLWARTIVDCASKEPSEGGEKWLWLVLVVFVPIVGAVIYLGVRRRKRIEQFGK